MQITPCTAALSSKETQEEQLAREREARLAPGPELRAMSSSACCISSAAGQPGESARSGPFDCPEGATLQEHGKQAAAAHR